MRTSIKLLVFALILGMTVACNNAPEGQKVEAGEATNTPTTTSTAPMGSATYSVSPQASQVIWTAAKLAGKQHTGTLAIQSGEINLDGENILGGKFILDMTSITNLDQKPGEGKEKLEGHLKSGDFFEVEKHPTGTFEITNVSTVADQADVTHNVTGNLTLKGITKSVTIPTKVNVGNHQFAAVTPQFTIDRTEWDVKFNSGLLGTAKDKIINDEVGLKLVVRAIDESMN